MRKVKGGLNQKKLIKFNENTINTPIAIEVSKLYIALKTCI